MNIIKRMIKNESTYLLLLLFIILVNVLVFTSGSREKGSQRTASESSLSREESSLAENEAAKAARARMVRVLEEKPRLRTLLYATSIAVLLAIIAGLLVDFILLALALEKKVFFERKAVLSPPQWTFGDVVRMTILFMFFGYVVTLVESFLFDFLPFLRHGHMRMIFNSTVMDILAIMLIAHFALIQYGARLSSIGLSFKDVSKNIFFGITGYIAAIPLFLVTIIIIIAITKLVGYVPERQRVVDLFLKEENTGFLLYSSIFAAVFGPFAEELFFRGFLYGAVKKKIGVLYAAFFTSAIFAMLHANIVGFFPIMILGVLLVYVYEKTGSLISSITVHIFHNLVMLYLVFVARQLGVT